MPIGKPGTFTLCTVEGCDGKSVGRGLCRKHYTRMWVHGDTSTVFVRERGGCSVAGCGRPHKAQGLCQTHYRRLRRHGDADHVERVVHLGSPEERFWKKVDKHGAVPTHLPVLGECWLWKGYIRPDGYGEFGPAGRMVHAYRWGYEQFVGPVPAGYELDHLCRNPACVRPSHLQPVTHAENMRRGTRGQATHCAKGHPYDEANTIIASDGARRCRTCHNERRRTIFDTETMSLNVD